MQGKSHLFKDVPTAGGNVNLCATVGEGLSVHETNARAPARDDANSAFSIKEIVDGKPGVFRSQWEK